MTATWDPAAVAQVPDPNGCHDRGLSHQHSGPGHSDGDPFGGTQSLARSFQSRRSRTAATVNSPKAIARQPRQPRRREMGRIGEQSLIGC
jgi:hypothetical protein